LPAGGAIDPVAADWHAADRNPLAIAAVEASASLGDAYQPERICDGDRHSKWVCPTRPGPLAPQWIALTLAGGPQRVEGVGVFGERIDNDGDRDIRLGTVHLIRFGADGAWGVGGTWEPPAAVYIQGHSLLRSKPFDSPQRGGHSRQQSFRSSGVLALTTREPRASLAIGYLSATEASPDLTATFVLDEGGTELTAPLRFLGRVLGPGADPVGSGFRGSEAPPTAPAGPFRPRAR